MFRLDCKAENNHFSSSRDQDFSASDFLLKTYLSKFTKSIGNVGGVFEHYTSTSGISISNPFDNTIRIAGLFRKNEKLFVELIDAAGKKQISTELQSNEQKVLLIPTASIASGIYTLKISRLANNDMIPLLVQCVLKAE